MAIIGICANCKEPVSVLHHVDQWVTREVVVEEEKGWGSNPTEKIKRTRIVNELIRKSLCGLCKESVRAAQDMATA